MKRILEVQKEIGSLSKNAKNPFFKSQYLDLNTLLNEVKPLLEAEGLILMQPIIADRVASIIIDSENGNTLCESVMIIPPSITDPQKLGSAITYFRRYTLKSLLAIAEEDDDGNGASKPEPIKETPKVFTPALAKEYKKKGSSVETVTKMFNLTKEQQEKYNKL